MELRFARSAAKQGISHERITYVIEHCGLAFDSEDSEDIDGVVIYLGDDWRGVELEVAAIERNDGLIVVHAMRLRDKFREMYVRALPWRR